MAVQSLTAIVLAAGLGTRMKSALPKVLHRIAGRPMVAHLVATVETLAPDRVVAVVGPEGEAVAKAVAPHPTVVQTDRLGTAHAVLAARETLAAISGEAGTVLVLFGDSPLIRAETLQALTARRAAADNPAVVVLGFRPEDPAAYGRLVQDDAGNLTRIVEAKDAGPDELAITLCNSGVMALDATCALSLLDRIGNDNAKGEFYLTDVVALAIRAGRKAAVIEAAEEETLGVNSRVELAAAEAILQGRLRRAAMEAGATLADPASTYFSYDTQLGRDVEVGPNVVFGPGVTVGDNVTIKAFCHFEEATVADGAIVGPYARLRPGAEVGVDAHIGNFVEIKKAVVEEGAKVNHLTYIGDARVGAGANVGAGTITCNYDGFFKSHTDIGAGAFIGSNTALVAPVKIGDGAIIGAGSTISHDVPADALAVERAKTTNLPGWAAKFRKQKTAEKEAAKKKG
ncbi:MAG: bifunctional UDP-N-acetylglucosamine diphosphorylase/glucosamine-1-phosphate N-acetyltransferase GlmU [Rhodospirillales bacterium]